MNSLNYLIRDRLLLQTLRAGGTTNVIQTLEIYLDSEICDTMSYRESLQSRYRDLLDTNLVKIAHYREQYPRHIDIVTDDDRRILGSNNVIGYEMLSAKQKQVDAILHNYVKH